MSRVAISFCLLVISVFTHAQENHKGSDSIICTEADAWEAILQHEYFTKILDSGRHLVFDNAYYIDTIGVLRNAFKCQENCMFQMLFDPRNFEYLCDVERNIKESHYNAIRRLQKSDVIGKRIPIDENIVNKARSNIHFINTRENKLDMPFMKSYFFPYSIFNSKDSWGIRILVNEDIMLTYAVNKNDCSVSSFDSYFFDYPFCIRDYNLLKNHNLQMSLDSFLIYEYPRYLQGISDWLIEYWRE